MPARNKRYTEEGWERDRKQTDLHLHFLICTLGIRMPFIFPHSAKNNLFLIGGQLLYNIMLLCFGHTTV